MDPYTRSYRYYDAQAGTYVREYYVGEGAMQLRGVLKLSYPVSRGIIDDWTAMEKVWHHVFFTELGADPAEHPVALVYGTMTPRSDLERIAETMFETFNVPALCLVSDGLAALASVGKKSGLLLNLRDDYTEIVPCIGGQVIIHAVQKLDRSVHAAHTALRRLLARKGKMPDDLRWNRVYYEDMVDKLGSVFGQAGSRPGRKSAYILPDGEAVSIEGECDECFDVYFRPEPEAHVESQPIQQAILQSIEKAISAMDQEASRREFIAALADIHLVGPGARFPGWPERLAREIHDAAYRPSPVAGTAEVATTAAPDLSPARFIVAERPGQASWRGLARIAEASSGDLRCWVKHEEYRESGPSVIHRLRPEVFVGGV